jgi:hypothetical protein
MGLMNMIQKPNIKSCQELSSEEIKEAQDSLNKRIKHYRPKIVAFNGKTIYEIYTGSSVDKEFNFGKQPITFANNTTDTYMYVMPSSSARCSQLPKVADKVPFYAALLKFRDHLCGNIRELSDLEIMFPDFKVALEVNNDEINTPNSNNNNSKIKSIKKDYMSDSEDNNSMLDESIVAAQNDQNTPLNNNPKIKFVRLNNIPFSEIPNDILENLKIQRKLKKNVTIITTTKGLFQKNVKKSNLFPKRKSLSNINASSDLDTATSDSSDYCTNSMSNEPTEQQPIVSSSSSSSSKLTSLILNVCNSASSNNSNGTANVHVSHTSPVLNNNRTEQIINKPALNPSPLALSPMSNNTILVNNKSGNNSTIKQILAAPISNQIQHQQQKSIIDNNNKIKIMSQSSQFNNNNSNNTNKESQIYIPQSKVIQLNNNANDNLNKKVIIINSNNCISSQPTIPLYETNENDFLIEYELIVKNQYSHSDYYTFESLNQQNHISSQELNHDLNRVVKLYLGDETSELISNENKNKRNFASMNDANDYVHSIRDFKRKCNVNFNKL